MAGGGFIALIGEMVRPILEAKDVGQAMKGSASEVVVNDSVSWFEIVNLTTTSGDFVGITIRKGDDTTRLVDQLRVTVDGESAETFLCRANPNPYGGGVGGQKFDDANIQFALPCRFRSAFKLEAKGTAVAGTVSLTAQWREDI
jgi:hypothetical protein